MSRNLDTTMAAALASGSIRVAFFVVLTFRSSIQYVWTGVGDFVYAGNTYKGVGSLGQIGAVVGGVDVQAEGTSVSLSGIDNALLQDALTDIRVGAPARITWALLNDAMQILGTPYLLYAGTMDAPSVTLGVKTSTIAIKIENRMIDLQRARQRRYTAADQRREFPTDSAFNWVEILNDASFKEGTA